MALETAATSRLDNGETGDLESSLCERMARSGATTRRQLPHPAFGQCVLR